MFRKGKDYLARSLNSIAQIPRQILFRTDSLLSLMGSIKLLINSLTFNFFKQLVVLSPIPHCV